MSNEADENRRQRIARQRDGAVEAQVGTPEEGRIVELIGVGHSLYTVKERAIYRFQLADVVDPERLNDNLPHQVQAVANRGASSPLVASTFLTANVLLNPHHIPEQMREPGLRIYFDLMACILAADDQAKSLADIVSRCEVESRAVGHRVQQLPSIRDGDARANAFILNAKRATQLYWEACCVMIGIDVMRRQGALFDGLQGELVRRWGNNDPRIRVVELFVSFCKFARNMRHCVEHSRDNQRIDVRDFALAADGHLTRPSIEVVHAETGHDRMDMVAFFRQITDILAGYSETLMLILCGAVHNSHFAGMPIAISVIPEEQRPNNLRAVNLGYVTQINGAWHHLG
jgi:hypothetical protein